MRIERIYVRNFRRLEDTRIEIDEKETVFVGPNNSGKTSATAVFRCFLGKRPFRVHDFSVSRISDIDAFAMPESGIVLPEIQLDIWFKIDPETVEFGRAFTLLPNLSDDFKSLGIRLCFGASEPTKMREAYRAAYPATPEEPAKKSLAEFLAQDGEFNRHFQITYFSLEKLGEDVLTTKLDETEGKKLLRNLIRVDFVDAQRNIDDEEANRSNKLSNAFASFYRNNLEEPAAAAEAHKVIDQNNAELSAHYRTQFKPLMDIIQGLGIPSIHDRSLKIVSTLSPETALKGSTDLLYIDEVRSHELPELYNGLGFKNLIYMAIQAKHFHSQWVRTPHDRPLCQIIFIEEPEVHLHAQVQQTFIANIWTVLDASAKAEGVENLKPQLVITTHSSHILDATEFAKVRYFRRRHLKDEDPLEAKILNATEVHSLSDFKPKAVDLVEQKATAEEALDFLKRYLRLTHCDLFFADAAILVEGSVEKLLLPAMIDKAANRLRSSYLTILEIGGAYAHRFDELLSFLSIPYLIITDLDSVSPDGYHPVCRADVVNAQTSNASLKALLTITTVKQLMELTAAQKTTDLRRYVTFQGDILVTENGAKLNMRPRTLEEAFAYQNFKLVRDGAVELGVPIPADLPGAYQVIYEQVKSDKFKKTDFAMRILSASVQWQVPSYISEGLLWLELRLHGPKPEGQVAHD